jgi:hypothetical protein
MVPAEASFSMVVPAAKLGFSTGVGFAGTRGRRRHKRSG